MQSPSQNIESLNLVRARNLYLKSTALGVIFTLILVMEVSLILFFYDHPLIKDIPLLYYILAPLSLVFVVALEFSAARWFKHALNQQKYISRPFEYSVSVIEALYPTYIVFYAAEIVGLSNIVEPTFLLASPPTLVYFFFIILSSLHLNFGISFTVGLIASVGYLYLDFHLLDFATDGLNLTMNLIKSGFLLICGVIAGIISQRIKTYVVESLDAKDTLINRLDEEVKKQTREIQQQKDQLEQHNREILSSIEYASRIQSAILPDSETLEQLFPQYFIFYLPCEAVSGDFYWTAKVNGSIVFTVADCTGHGVPGAFMSMIGNDLLNHIVRENREVNPESILEKLDHGVMRALKQKGKTEEMKDGMDMALCTWQPQQNQMLFSGAHNPLYLIREGELQEYSASRFPVGGYFKDKSFTQQTVNLQKGDMLYLFSDGFPDQFGGPRGKKFMYSQFRALLIDIHGQPLKKQEETLQQTIEEWMAQNDEEQIDDICVMGVKV